MPRSPEWSPDFPSRKDTSDSKQENREKGQVSEVSETFLENFYSSRDFASKLKATSGKVREFGGRELGFGFWKHITSDKTLFTEIVGSPFENMAYVHRANEELESKLAQAGSEKEFIILGTLHFHPDKGGDPLIIPSGSDGDLGYSSDDRERNQQTTHFDVPTIEMIAVHLFDGEMKILTYQEPPFYEPMKRDAIRGEIDETLPSFLLNKEASQESVVDVLRHYRYKAEVVRTVKQKFSEEGLKKLRAFAFTPRPVKVEGQG